MSLACIPPVPVRSGCSGLHLPPTYLLVHSGRSAWFYICLPFISRSALVLGSTCLPACLLLHLSPHVSAYSVRHAWPDVFNACLRLPAPCLDALGHMIFHLSPTCLPACLPSCYTCLHLPQTTLCTLSPCLDTLDRMILHLHLLVFPWRFFVSLLVPLVSVLVVLSSSELPVLTLSPLSQVLKQARKVRVDHCELERFELLTASQFVSVACFVSCLGSTLL